MDQSIDDSSMYVIIRNIHLSRSVLPCLPPLHVFTTFLVDEVFSTNLSKPRNW
uniref:Uncharacterized protein n=1 Tax=Arundo donax TaxID=35708 RepID=A0A0A9DGE4_ARUDO